MLTRAVRRPLRRGIPAALLAEHNQLALPPLCPSISQSILRQSVRSSATLKFLRLRRASRSSGNGAKSHTRQLATAAEPSLYGAYEDVPFDFAATYPPRSSPSPVQYPFEPPQRPLSELKNMDMSDRNNLAILPDDDYALLRYRPQSKGSMPGGIPELQQSIYACVSVGRMDRAASLIRYLTQQLHGDAAVLQDVHLKYVSSLVDALMREPSRDKLVGVQKWIELDMRAQGVMVGHRVLLLLLKSSFLTLEGARLDRTLRRYMNWIEDPHSEEMQEMLSSSLFSDSEWTQLMSLAQKSGAANAYEHSLHNSLETSNEPSAEDSSLPEVTITEADELPQATPSIADEEPLTLRETHQKGFGLSALKASLISLQSHELKSVHPQDGKDARVVLQERLESDVLDAAIQKWRDENARAKYDTFEGQLSSSGLGAHLYTWSTNMASALRAQLERADELMSQTTEFNDNSSNMNLFLVAPWLKSMDLQKASAAALVAFMEAVIHEDLKAAKHFQKETVVSGAAPGASILGLRGALQDIFRAVLTEARAERLLEANRLEKRMNLPSKERKRRVFELFRKESKEMKEAIMAGETPDFKGESSISHELKLRIAAFLLTTLLKEAKLPIRAQNPKTNKSEVQMQPIGKHVVLFKNGQKYGALEIHQDLISRLKREPPSGMIAKHLPMLAPPRPWTSLNQGAYLTSQTEVVRIKNSNTVSEAYLKLADKRGDLRQVYAALDGLSEVPWKINRAIFDVMTRVWNTGQQFAKLAPLEPQLDLPAEPEPSDKVARARWRAVARSIENQASSMHSQRCFQNFQLEVARSFINDEFFCPHNIDFRGRAYPIPPYLNHMGPDYVRALFTFSKGKKLGERGLYWLKVHLANVYGFDKAPMDERAQFTDQHIRDVYDSAENPLDGEQWWLRSDDAWQTLAACMELRNALESPVPTEYVSTLGVQQDGSCNGLQHYAALGGDPLGAEQVNLAPGDKPGDVYTGVLQLVNKRVDKDAENGHAMARQLQGRLTRKCVKQPVMTNVYGVTYIGAKAQVKKQLVTIFDTAEVRSGKVNLGDLAGYVAHLIFASLQEMFSGAHKIQQWLGECGTRISRCVTPEQLARLQERIDGPAVGQRTPGKSVRGNKRWLNEVQMNDCVFRSPIVWTTPLGLPVVQPYRESAARSIETSLQSVRVFVNGSSEAVHKRRQLQGLPPNFIHSLDASHMMLTSLRFRELGRTFAAIHDGFWTHAADVDLLNTELRDAFVRMHGEDIVGRLREEFNARYSGCIEWAPIIAKSKAGKRIVAHYRSLKRPITRYCRAVVDTPLVMLDALREQERQRLLNSEDPAQVEEGRNMETAASIVEEENALDETPDSATSTPAGEEIEGEGLEDAGDEFQGPEPVAMQESSADAAEAAEAASGEDSQTRLKNPKRRRVTQRLLYYWRPITFPHAPEKGSFDVSRVRDSRYFFS